MDFNPELAYDLLDKSLPETERFFTSDMSVRDAAIMSLRESFLKKWLPKDMSGLEDIAISSFIESNMRCRKLADFPQDTYYYSILCTARALMHEYINSNPLQTSILNLTDILQEGIAGPGASVGTRHTDFFNKMFNGPLSTTSKGLHVHYVNNLSDRWIRAELSRFARFGLAVVEGSKLSTVPKSSKTNRTICTEPSLNMFYQLGAGKCIEKVLRTYHNIDLSLQPDRNREYARLGSIDGSYATIDLSNASDTISTKLVKFLLPAEAYGTLDLIRSKRTIYQGMVIELDLFSSMGNGFTFPLQTLIFATLVRAVYLHMGLPMWETDKPTYSVFGDDIICRRTAYDTVISVLEYAGFKVNRLKSFNTGSFRESCGSDFFKGRDVRGVYLREVKNEAQVYSAFNRLVRWSVKHSIDINPVLCYLKGLARFRPVPFDAGDEEGIKCPTALLRGLKRDHNGAWIYRALVRSTRARRVDDKDETLDGAIICAIGGYIRDRRVCVRSNGTEPFKVVRRKTPSWDFIPDPARQSTQDAYIKYPHPELTLQGYYMALATLV